jgi:type II secretory pathway pseudopilin PulG
MKRTEASIPCGVTRRRSGRAKTGEEGFVLLLIFAMAAAVALLIYMELPRVSFEAQRNREQLLIERGEQYKRAIQLYFRKFKTYPASIEQLENTNNVRFLRRRYADPLTGKNEWRLIHIGPGGVFTDSITHKPKKDQKKEETITSQLMEAPAIGSSPADAQRASGAPPRRPSEGGQPQPGGDFAAGADGTVGQPGTGQAGNPSGDPNQQIAGQPGTGQPSQPGMPRSPVPAFPGVPGNPVNPGAQQPGVTPDGQPQQPNPVPFGPPGADPNMAGGNQAADMIRNLLTRPRPMPGSAAAPGAGGTQIGVGSIAGVASKVEKQSIKIYNERDQYNEWEFIYDFAQDRTGAGRMAGNMGAGDPRLGQQPGGQPMTGAPGFGGQPAFAGQPGFGGQSGFGSQPGFGPRPGTGSGGFGSSAGQPSSGSSGGIGSNYGLQGPGGGTSQPPTTPPRQQPQPGAPQPVAPPPVAPPPPPPATPPNQDAPPTPPAAPPEQDAGPPP